MYAEEVMNILGIIGIVAFSVSGAMVGIGKNADILGVVILGCVTATGGGIMRDILLGLFPPYSILDGTYITVAALCALVVFCSAYKDSTRYSDMAYQISSVTNILDAVGLGVFSVMGAELSIACGFGSTVFTPVIIGTITATGGGVLRDVLVREVPMVLTHRIYAIASMAGSALYYFLYMMEFSYPISAFSGAIATFILRLFATYYKWDLPSVYEKER